MTRYFFDIYNDTDTVDEEGLEFADAAAAIARATTEARVLAADSIARHGHLVLSHRIAVRAEDGGQIAIVRFGDAVDVKD